MSSGVNVNSRENGRPFGFYPKALSVKLIPLDRKNLLST
jgi:hypothetical protein